MAAAELWASAGGERAAFLLPPQLRNRRRCQWCQLRKVSHSGAARASNGRNWLALCSGCESCMTWWVDGGYEVLELISDPEPEPTYDHVCDWCGQAFRTSQGRDAHKRTAVRHRNRRNP